MSRSPHLKSLTKSFSKSDFFSIDSGRRISLFNRYQEQLKKVDSYREDKKNLDFSEEFYKSERCDVKDDNKTEEISRQIMTNIIKTLKQLIKKVIYNFIIF